MEILSSEGVNISYHSWISQVKESVVNDEPVWSRGMEEGKVSVSGDVAIEVGTREGSGVKGCSIDGSIFCPSSL